MEPAGEHLAGGWPSGAGGGPARVYFCDAAFARRTADKDEGPDDAQSSLLVGMRHLLAPYFAQDGPAGLPPRDGAVVRILYEPLYAALTGLKGVAHADL